jgi:alkanesulfonate monooxygenase SsuD/methylene tetrahydromethanopterin reductase-like flavin-dependent oxidoreductase (luciferase family)
VFKHDPELPDSAVTPEYMAEHLWLIGSPDTVEAKLRDLYGASGGFGTLLVLIYDYMEDQARWERSMNLLAKEVMPRLAEMVPE